MRKTLLKCLSLGAENREGKIFTSLHDTYRFSGTHWYLGQIIKRHKGLNFQPALGTLILFFNSVIKDTNGK